MAAKIGSKSSSQVISSTDPDQYGRRTKKVRVHVPSLIKPVASNRSFSTQPPREVSTKVNKILDQSPQLEPKVTKKQGFDSFTLSARSLHEAKNFTKAIEAYKEAYKLTQKDELKASILNNIGLAYFEMKDYPNACKCYEKAFQKTNDDNIKATILCNNCICLSELDQYDEVIQLYEKALDLINDDDDRILEILPLQNKALKSLLERNESLSKEIEARTI